MNTPQGLFEAIRDLRYQCHGVLKSSIYFDDNWLRFKVVRNPYDRVVSSYFENIRSSLIKEINESSTFYN